MLWFTERESYGYDRLCKSLNLPGVDFSLRDNGEDLKLAKGGCWKGPSILPREISLSSFFWTSPEFWVAVKAFLLVRGHSGPSKSSLNPFKNPSVRYSASWYPSSNLHSLSGCIGLGLFVTVAGTFMGGVSAVAYVACVFVLTGRSTADRFGGYGRRNSNHVGSQSASGWWIFGRSLLLWNETTAYLCACRPVSLGRDVLCAMNNVWLPGLVCSVYHSFSNHHLLSWFVARCCCMRVWR